MNLTKEVFLQKIADYENNPGIWKFLGDKPALIDFYAPWCGPCRMLSPVLEELSQEYDGKIDIYKVNVDEQEELSQIFAIRSVPTLIFIPMNGEPQRATGALPKSQLVQIFNDLLLK